MVEEEIEQLVEGIKNENVDKFMEDIFNSQEDPDTRIEPMSDKEITAQDAPLSTDKEKLKELMVTNPKPSSSTPSPSLQKPKIGRFRRYKSFINTTINIKRSSSFNVDSRVNEIAKKTILQDSGVVIVLQGNRMGRLYHGQTEF
ncbi:hypothetical protein Tco_1028807 [Tanacetum coccineum]|uniref:Uncharacterized protein n=1 Tax=Tanacetum coccineum TaxID=301880 RepID=A0ABQ5G1Y9_9ASTR